MPDIFLDLRRIDYVSDQNAPVSAWRAHAETLFATTTSALASFSCIVDTGAPFSVLPFSLWQSCNVQWNPLGQQLTCQGRPAQGGAEMARCGLLARRRPLRSSLICKQA